jgi:hypothetical protein
MNDEKLYETGYSDCCGAGVLANSDVCSECHEHCNIEPEYAEL